MGILNSDLISGLNSTLQEHSDGALVLLAVEGIEAGVDSPEIEILHVAGELRFMKRRKSV
jgi:hypothetical protein